MIKHILTLASLSEHDWVDGIFNLLTSLYLGVIFTILLLEVIIE